MTINKNWTYSSDGGYAAKQKQKEYVPKSVAKKASLMLREQERQRLIEAAKRLDAQTRGAAAPENSGFSMVNSRQTFPEVIAANRNAGAGNVQSGSAAPRNVRDVLDQPESTWRSGKFNGVIDPRAKNEFLNNIGAGSSAPKPAPKPAEKPEEEKKPQVFLSDAQKTRYGLLSNMGEIAGGEVYDYLAPVKDWIKESKDKEYKPTPREEFLYNRYNNMGEIAGGDFYDYFEKFKNPSLVDYTPTPREKQRQEISDGVFRRYVEGEKVLNTKDFGDVINNGTYASVNYIRGTPANTLSTLAKRHADIVETCCNAVGVKPTPEVLDWYRSIDDNNDILSMSRIQYDNMNKHFNENVAKQVENIFNKYPNLRDDSNFIYNLLCDATEIDWDVAFFAEKFADELSAKAEARKLFPVVLGLRTKAKRYEELREQGASVLEAYIQSDIDSSRGMLTDTLGQVIPLFGITGGAINSLSEDAEDVFRGRKEEINWSNASKELLYGLFTTAASESFAGVKIIYNLILS